MLSESFRVSVRADWSTMWKIGLKSPVAVGVPDRRPPLLSEIPGGNSESCTTTDDGLVVWSNGVSSTIVAREGQPVPGILGRNYETLTNSLDANNNGDWVTVANLDGATTDDLVVLLNGTDVIAREGSTLPSIAGGWALTGFGSGPVLIDAKSDVVWFGDWNDPDTTKDTGIFMNDQLIVQEGVTMVGGS